MRVGRWAGVGGACARALPADATPAHREGTLGSARSGIAGSAAQCPMALRTGSDGPPSPTLLFLRPQLHPALPRQIGVPGGADQSKELSSS